MTSSSPAPADLLQQAVSCHQTGRLEEARELYRRVVALDDGNADAWNLLGLLSTQEGRHHTAVSLLRKAIQRNPSVPQYHNNLGVALAALQRPRDSEAAFKAALALWPDYPDARQNLAAVQDQFSLGEALVAYQRSVEELRRSPYMDWPYHVHLETLAVCNARCLFCPSSVLKRQGARMSDALIAKVIDDLTEIPSHLSFRLSPYKVNEPFLDQRLFDLLALCNQRLPNAVLSLTTNASPITEKHLARLSRVRGMDSLWVSVNDHRPEEYERVMGLPFARTLERLEMLHRWKASREAGMNVVLSRVGDGTEADREFRTWVAGLFPHFESFIFPRGAWLGQVDASIPAPPAIGCKRWFELSITATGVVAHCCMDGQAEHPLGDVSRESVLEVYNKPAYRALRERAASRLDVTPCDRCSFR